jgi:hypothetical protein
MAVWVLPVSWLDSDIDVVVVTESNLFINSEDWISGIVDPDAKLLRTGDWGALIERRVQMPFGLEIEFGFVKPSWADIDPIDQGTQK